MSTLPFVTKLNELAPELRIGGEAQHTIRQALIVRWLDRAGMPASAYMDLDGADAAVMFDRAQRIAARYLRLYGLLIAGWAPDAHEAGAIVDDEAVRVEVRTAFGFIRRVRVWVQGEMVGVMAWSMGVRDLVEATRSAVFAACADERARFNGLRPAHKLSERGGYHA